MSNTNEPFNGNTATLKDNIVSALIYFFQMLCFILFLCPFAFWSAAAKRLAKEKESRSLFSFSNNSPWPFLTFCKKVFFEYIIDGTIFMSYFLGALFALFSFFYSVGDGFGGAFVGFLSVLIGTYYFPMVISWVRDLVYMCFLLPIRKFISWLSKPAQYMDLKQNVDLKSREK